MALFGYTPGGSPIFVGGDKKLRVNTNQRFKCSHGCGAKTTRNQRKKNGNICHQCHKPFKHTNGL